MKFHHYAPYILESEPLDGKYARMRIYRHGIKDSAATYYTLHGVGPNFVHTRLAKCQTAQECIEMAEDFT